MKLSAPPVIQSGTEEPTVTAEQDRLNASRQRMAHWKRWGPYLSERAWGTVREDYSADGTAWEFFPHDHARSRAYRWNEDGIAGICDRHQFICFALALWNGRDPILKERLFGLTGNEGNHGEDVKEYYFYLDSTPTHSYMKYLYKYPQAAFPYASLVEENRRRGQERQGIRAARHRRVRRGPLLRRLRRVCQGHARRYPDPHQVSTVDRRRPPCTCCRRYGSATPGRGAARHPADFLRRAAGRVARSSRSHEPTTVNAGSVRRRAGAAVHRKRNQLHGCSVSDNVRLMSRTASTTTSCMATATR